MPLRKTLLQIAITALNAVKGEPTVKRSLANLNYQQFCNQHCHLIAIGKAAESMSLGAVHQPHDAI